MKRSTFWFVTELKFRIGRGSIWFKRALLFGIGRMPPKPRDLRPQPINFQLGGFNPKNYARSSNWSEFP